MLAPCAAKTQSHPGYRRDEQYRDPEQQKFSYADLQAKRVSDINPNCIEAYLSEDEFQRLIGVRPAAFYQLPQWKQREIRKRLDLF